MEFGNMKMEKLKMNNILYYMIRVIYTQCICAQQQSVLMSTD